MKFCPFARNLVSSLVAPYVTYVAQSVARLDDVLDRDGQDTELSPRLHTSTPLQSVLRQSLWGYEGHCMPCRQHMSTPRHSEMTCTTNFVEQIVGEEEDQQPRRGVCGHVVVRCLDKLPVFVALHCRPSSASQSTVDGCAHDPSTHTEPSDGQKHHHVPAGNHRSTIVPKPQISLRSWPTCLARPMPRRMRSLLSRSALFLRL